MKVIILLTLLAVLLLIFTKYTLPRKHNIVRGTVFTAWRLSSFGLYLPALAFYNLAKVIEPDYYQIYVFRGDNYFMMQKYKNAKADYLKTLELKPGDKHAIEALGPLYTASGEYDNAIRTYENLLLIDPLRSDYYYTQIGVNYWRLKNYNKALEAFDKVKKPEPKYVNVYYYRSIIYREIHEYDMAISECEKAIDLNPDDRTSIYLQIEQINRSKEQYLKELMKTNNNQDTL